MGKSHASSRARLKQRRQKRIASCGFMSSMLVATSTTSFSEEGNACPRVSPRITRNTFGGRVFARTGAKSLRAEKHGRRWTKRLHDGGQDRGPGRRGQLARAFGKDWDPAQERGGRGRWHGHQPVRRVESSRSQHRRRRRDGRGRKPGKRRRRAHDVGDGVPSPDLVKRHLVHRHPMQRRLGHRDALEDVLGQLLRLRIQSRPPKQPANFRVVAMLVAVSMRMVVRMPVVVHMPVFVRMAMVVPVNHGRASPPSPENPH